MVRKLVTLYWLRTNFTTSKCNLKALSTSHGIFGRQAGVWDKITPNIEVAPEMKTTIWIDSRNILFINLGVEVVGPSTKQKFWYWQLMFYCQSWRHSSALPWSSPSAWPSGPPHAAPGDCDRRMRVAVTGQAGQGGTDTGSYSDRYRNSCNIRLQSKQTIPEGRLHNMRKETSVKTWCNVYDVGNLWCGLKGGWGPS